MTGTKVSGFEYLAPRFEDDPCPKHGTPVRKTYTFGQRDAEVTTFSGCRCAVCVNTASLQCGTAMGHEYTYHKSYSEAAGRARLIVMQEDVDNAPFN